MSSVSKALEHPALSHEKRPFRWQQGRREEREGKGTGRIIERRETVTSVTQLSAEPHISKAGTSPTSPAT